MTFKSFENTCRTHALGAIYPTLFAVVIYKVFFNMCVLFGEIIVAEYFKV